LHIFNELKKKWRIYKMRKFSSAFSVGVRVVVNGIDGIYEVSSINESRTNICLKGLAGSFQWGHVRLFKTRYFYAVYSTARVFRQNNFCDFFRFSSRKERDDFVSNNNSARIALYKSVYTAKVKKSFQRNNAFWETNQQGEKLYLI
jgi:hypothetical protein